MWFFYPTSRISHVPLYVRQGSEMTAASDSVTEVTALTIPDDYFPLDLSNLPFIVELWEPMILFIILSFSDILTTNPNNTFTDW